MSSLRLYEAEFWLHTLKNDKYLVKKKKNNPKQNVNFSL